MNIFQKYSKKLLCAGLTMALGMSFIQTSLFDSQAAGYNKVGEGTYQLLDGTAITGVVARGVDVSRWQGNIDWAKVAADDISFVMLGTRVSTTGEVDPYFHQNARNAQANGVKLGAYIYSTATDVAMAEAEADFVLNLVKDYPISYPIAFDLESDSIQGGLSPQVLAQMVNAFCAKIEAAGYYPVLYANDYWLAKKIDMSMVKYDVWVARYEIKHSFASPAMWQATSSGSVNGISGNVDINFQYKDFSNLIASDLWRTIGGVTYYYKNFSMQKDSWIHDGNGWYYMNSTGQPGTGWFRQNGVSYYLNESNGRMTQGWLSTADGWHYFNESGAMQTGWVNDGVTWYNLNQNGVMQTGWLRENNIWYYLNNSGAMVTGWQQVGQQWYFFNGSGVMKTGWVGSDAAWYYLDPASGAMVANTQITVDGITYQVDGNGVCTELVPEQSAQSAEQENTQNDVLITPISPQ